MATACSSPAGGAREVSRGWVTCPAGKAPHPARPAPLALLALRRSVAFPSSPSCLGASVPVWLTAFVPSSETWHPPPPKCTQTPPCAVLNTLGGMSAETWPSPLSQFPHSRRPPPAGPRIG